MDINRLNALLRARHVTLGADGDVFPVVEEPVEVERAKYDALLQVQLALNAIFAAEADFSFVDAVSDEYVVRLREIHASKPSADAVVLTFMRSDYILDTALAYKQVEVNVFSIAFPAFAQIVAHEARTLDSAVVESRALDLLLDGMLEAGRIFDTHHATQSVFVMLTQPDEKNINDQLHIVRALAARGRTAVRIPLAHAPRRLAFDAGRCCLDGTEVSLVYYRAGYRPDEYTDDVWAARRRIEHSRCIKLPDIARTLLNTKLYQRVFSTHPLVRPHACAFHDTLQPRCVVKPMREGGANNVFVCGNMPVDTRDCVIMDHIDAHVETHTVAGRRVQTVSELSTFGIHLQHCGTDVLTRADGYLIRTKSSSAPEGCVTLGTAAFAVMKFK